VIKLRRTGTTLDLSQSGKEELRRKEEEKRKREREGSVFYRCLEVDSMGLGES